MRELCCIFIFIKDLNSNKLLIRYQDLRSMRELCCIFIFIKDLNSNELLIAELKKISNTNVKYKYVLYSS